MPTNEVQIPTARREKGVCMDQGEPTPHTQEDPHGELTPRDYQKPSVVPLGSLAEMTWTYSVEAEEWTW